MRKRRNDDELWLMDEGINNEEELKDDNIVDVGGK